MRKEQTHKSDWSLQSLSQIALTGLELFLLSQMARFASAPGVQAQEAAPQTESLTEKVYFPLISKPRTGPYSGVNFWTYDENAGEVMDHYGVINSLRGDQIIRPDGTYMWGGDVAVVLGRIQSVIDGGNKPVVIFHGFPEHLRPEGSLKCEPVKEEHFPIMVQFYKDAIVQAGLDQVDGAMVIIGNELEVNALGVPDDEIMGCFGADGGALYGRFLAQVYPALKEAYPNLLIAFNGLGGFSTSLGFLEDALEAAAEIHEGPLFDVLPFHYYPRYYMGGTILDAWPNGLEGLIADTNTVLDAYNQDPLLFLSETYLGHNNLDNCYDPEVLQAQEDYVTYVMGVPGLHAITFGASHQ